MAVSKQLYYAFKKPFTRPRPLALRLLSEIVWRFIIGYNLRSDYLFSYVVEPILAAPANSQ